MFSEMFYPFQLNLVQAFFIIYIVFHPENTGEIMAFTVVNDFIFV